MPTEPFSTGAKTTHDSLGAWPPPSVSRRPIPHRLEDQKECNCSHDVSPKTSRHLRLIENDIDGVSKHRGDQKAYSAEEYVRIRRNGAGLFGPIERVQTDPSSRGPLRHMSGQIAGQR